MTTLANLVTTLRQRTDTVVSAFVTDSELEGYLNSALAELDDVLVNRFEDYKVTTTPLSITSGADGANYLACPADFNKLRGVDVQAGGRWVDLTRSGFAERNSYGPPTCWNGATPAFYRLEGRKVWIEPASVAVGTYRLLYVPRFTTLASGDSLPDHMDQQSWWDYAVAHAGICVLQKQDLDPSVFVGMKAAKAAHIVSSSGTRDAGGPRVPTNTRAMRRGWR